jgi:chemotaxis protein MotB
MPARRRRPERRRRDDHAGHERWMVSYADFITLLFALFATLYALSTVDAMKLSSLVDSMKQAFDSRAVGVSANGRGILSGGQRPDLAMVTGPGGQVGLAALQKRIEQQLGSELAEIGIEMELDPRGLVISVREAGSFQVGSADLSPPAQSLLAHLGSILVGIDNNLLVEGHTDDVPIHTARFASNWELSTTRATNVIAFLVEHAHLSPSHVSAAGYAEYHPRVPNSSEANRARNRRVDLVILNPESTVESPVQSASSDTKP